MEDFVKYLTSSTEDKNWGVYLTVAGKYTSPPHSAYPSNDHPSGYFFEWDKGRTLHEYQLNCITEGQGVLQIHNKEYVIEPGTVMLIMPNCKHRYRPNENVGWTENYIGFKGELTKHFIAQTFGNLDQPLILCKGKLEIIDTYQKIFDLVQHQQPAYQQIASALIIKLLGYINSYNKQLEFEGKEVENLVSSAKSYMWNHVDETVNFKEFSKKNTVSYSYFRKIFKSYTGIAPNQFYLDLKIMRARELLISTPMPIKEVSYKLGFESVQYFSRLFKNKTGFSPSILRKVMH